MTEAKRRSQGRSHKLPVFPASFSALSLLFSPSAFLELLAAFLAAFPCWCPGWMRSGTTRRKTGGNQANLSRSSLSPYLSSPVQIRLPSLNKISTDRKASVTPPKSNPFPHQIPNQPERLRYPCEIDSSPLLLLTAALQ